MLGLKLYLEDLRGNARYHVAMSGFQLTLCGIIVTRSQVPQASHFHS